MTQQFQLKALIVGIDKLSPTLRNINRNLGGFRRGLLNFGKGGIQMAAGLTAAIGITSKAFADFEDAGVRLKGSLMGASGEVAKEFGAINELALDLGNKLPGNTADFQNMMTSLVQQGVDAKDILQGVGQSAAYLGVQLQLAPEQAAEFAAKMRTATGATGKDMMALMDIIQRTANLGVKSEDMLAGFSKLTPAMDLMKVKGIEAGKALSPLLAMAIRTGMAGESAGNAYRKMFSAFFDSRKLNSVNQLLASRHIVLDFTNGKGEFGGIDKMFEQLSKLKNLTTQERIPLLKRLFGDDAETLQIVQLMIGQGKAGLDAMNAKMLSQASLQMRVEQQLGTLKNLFDAALGNAQNLLATIGEVYAPQIKSLTQRLGDMAAWAQDFVKNNGGLIKSITAIAIGFVGVKVAALGIAGALTLINGLTRVSPLGLFIRGLALAAGLIIANWEPISGFFNDLWYGVTKTFSDAWEKIKEIINGIRQPMGLFTDIFRAIIDPSHGILTAVGSAVGAAVGAKPASSLNSITSANQKVSGSIDVRFSNAPQGMRITGVNSAPSGMSINPDVGYNGFAMGMP